MYGGCVLSPHSLLIYYSSYRPLKSFSLLDLRITEPHDVICKTWDAKSVLLGVLPRLCSPAPGGEGGGGTPI